MEVTCVLLGCVQNCVRVTCAGTELRWYRYKTMNAKIQNAILKSKRVPEYNKFQG